MTLQSRLAWKARWPRSAECLPFLSWLHDRGSLTARLQRRGNFAVRILQQQRALATHDESVALGIHRTRLAWVREVVLSCDDQALVFAHTVLLDRPRGPMTRWLARLGNRSLGALLFSHPGFKRGAIRCKRLDSRHPLYARAVAAMRLEASPPPVLWARRSTFSFGRQSVLVTEVFSPALS